MTAYCLKNPQGELTTVIKYFAKDVREGACLFFGTDWKKLRKYGWRVSKVTVTEFKP